MADNRLGGGSNIGTEAMGECDSRRLHAAVDQRRECHQCVDVR
jgi:hypothetical protein